jgi:isopenicillin-N N-acyltransferase-like protein
MPPERAIHTGLRVVEAAGSPREMGRAHGEELRSTIADGLQRWFGLIETQTRMAGEAFVDSFLAATEFGPAIQTYAPTLIDEVRGIADGARQSFRTILAYQMMDEEWWYRRGLIPSGRAPAEACSAVGVVRDDGTSLIAQNMDLPSHYDGTQVLLRLRPAGEPEALVFGPAGLIGTTGLNQMGVAVCCNALPQLRHRPTGLPVGFLIRAILAQATVEDAATLVRTVAHATGQNYLLGGPGAIHDFECSAGQVREIAPAGSQLRHTNHPLANDDLIDEAEDGMGSTSRARLDKLESDLAGLGERATKEDVRRTLSDCDVPVCVSRGSDWMTLGSLIMDLAPDPVLHIAPGPPAETAYSEVRFS